MRKILILLIASFILFSSTAFGVETNYARLPVNPVSFNDTNVWTAGWLDDYNALTSDLDGGGNNLVNFDYGFFYGTVKGKRFESTLSQAVGAFAVAFGQEASARGDFSIATGYGTEAFGYASTAMGQYNTAYGRNSTALGFGTNASADNSTAMGRNTVASG
ncbi:MAG: hypothetical protein ABH821_02860, partial [archaeon]